MKIDDRPKSRIASERWADNGDRTPEKAGAEEGRKAPSGAEQIHLSPRAREYQHARQTLATVPDIDDDRVRAIRARVQSGRYRIEADQIAEKMIREALNDD